jgi:hypothetical protein
MSDSPNNILERAMGYVNARLPPPPVDWVDPVLPSLNEGEPHFRNMTAEELMESQRLGY